MGRRARVSLEMTRVPLRSATGGDGAMRTRVTPPAWMARGGARPVPRGTVTQSSEKAGRARRGSDERARLTDGGRGFLSLLILTICSCHIKPPPLPVSLSLSQQLRLIALMGQNKPTALSSGQCARPHITVLYSHHIALAVWFYI